MSQDQKSPVELWLDLFVYAPLGFALEARELVPRLAERGRQELEGRVGNARVLGQFAVQQGQTEAAKLIDRARQQAEGLLGARRPTTAPPGGGGSATAPAEPATPSGGTAPAADAAATAPDTGGDGSGDTSGEEVRAEDLPIPDYDSLAASQVVPRLANLSPAELELVRRYEEAHRGRKTILNRIAQLERRR